MYSRDPYFEPSTSQFSGDVTKIQFGKERQSIHMASLPPVHNCHHDLQIIRPNPFCTNAEESIIPRRDPFNGLDRRNSKVMIDLKKIGR